MDINISTNCILNWDLVLGLEEISDYLENPELKQLSAINSYLRRKLRSKIFHNFNLIGSPPNLSKYLDNSIQSQDALIEKVQGIIEEISSISTYFKRFTCTESINIYLLYPIFSNFTNLKSICFHCFFISLPILKNVLESIYSLEALELNRISAVEWNRKSVINTIMLSKIVKRMNIYNCRVFESTLNGNPMIYNINMYHHSNELFKIFLFEDILVLNLESLSVNGYLDFDTIRLNNVLSNAQYLKSFETEGCLVNQDTVNILNNLNYLEELNLFDDWEYIRNIDYAPWQLDIPVFKKLKTLSIKCQAAYKLYKNQTTSFPNLINLKLYYDPQVIRYFLERLNVKKLIISCKYREQFNVTIPSNSVESIEIITFCPQIISFDLFTRCSNLTILKITPINTKIGNASFEKVQEYYSKIRGWRSKLSNSSIICFKI